MMQEKWDVSKETPYKDGLIMPYKRKLERAQERRSADITEKGNSEEATWIFEDKVSQEELD